MSLFIYTITVHRSKQIDRYRTLPLEFLYQELGFDDVTEAREFLSTNGCAFFENPNSPDNEKIFDCRHAATPLTQLLEAKLRKVQIKGAI